MLAESPVIDGSYFIDSSDLPPRRHRTERRFLEMVGGQFRDLGRKVRQCRPRYLSVCPLRMVAVDGGLGVDRIWYGRMFLERRNGIPAGTYSDAIGPT